MSDDDSDRYKKPSNSSSARKPDQRLYPQLSKNDTVEDDFSYNLQHSGDRRKKSLDPASAYSPKSNSRVSTKDSDDDDDNKMEAENQYDILKQSAQSPNSNKNASYNPDTLSSSPIKKSPREKKPLPKPDQSSDEWTCSNCEATNNNAMRRCTNCREGPRPSSISSPPIEKTPKTNKSSKQGQSSGVWICSYCDSENNNDTNTCADCADGRRPSQNIQRKSNDLTVQPHLNSPKSSIIKSVSEKEIAVFIPEIPYDMSETEFKKMIQSRLETYRNIRPQQVICYPKLCIGIIFVKEEKDADCFIKKIQSIVLDPRTQVTIKFIDELELISYIVFDKQVKSSIQPDDVIQRWKQLSKLSYKCQCVRVSSQFPNIFKIIVSEPEEFKALELLPNFTVGEQQAKLYLNADCSFFEDLPNNLTKEDIINAVSTEIDHSYDEEIMYIQYNKKSSNVIVINLNAIDYFKKMTKVYFQNNMCRKKDSLTSREDSVTDATVKKDQNDNSSNTNKKSIKLKDESDSDRVPSGNAGYNPDDIREELHSTSSINNSRTMEINEKTWYESEMLTYEPDLGEFLQKPKLPIFEYRWNSQCWLEQFGSLKDSGTGKPDKKQRLLRISVMANTIGVLRKKYYDTEIQNQNKRITLRSLSMKTTVYDHHSKLSDRQEIDLALKRKYPETKVYVVQEDCLVIYQKLLLKQKNPVLLNMANSTTPGGGYRTGAGAQEETIFRRSNYYLSLDIELDENDETKRYRCTSECKKRPIAKQEAIYPIHNYGAIYTSGITVLRDTESTGYAFLEQPIYDVCAIASAACERPKLKPNNMLEDQAAVDMRKKIENFFAIAFFHEHNCLVLSAFGCGAFRNPPEHVAKIYKSIIEQYAGYFSEIYFAIIDDHNAKRKNNSQGNYQPFHEIFNNFKCKPSNTELDADMISGPYRVIRRDKTKLLVDHVKIYDRPLCEYASQCSYLDDKQHQQDFSHPPKCIDYNSCDQSTQDEIHANSFMHRKKSKSSDVVSKVVENECSNNDNYAHFDDKEHKDKQKQSSQKLCPLTPYVCKLHRELLQARSNTQIRSDIERHCNEFLHVCPFGSKCNKTSDPDHNRTSVHIDRHVCPNEPKCSKLSDEEHLNSFTHSGINDIRYVCRYRKSECPQTNEPDHISRYRHLDYSCDQLTVVPYHNLNKDISFIQNQDHMAKEIKKHLQSRNFTFEQDLLQPVRQYVRNAQPIYRCNQVVFQSIIIHGCVMSRNYVNNLSDPKNVIRATSQHSEIRTILDKCNDKQLKKQVRKYIEVVVQNEFDRLAPKNQAIGYGDNHMYGSSNCSSSNQSQQSDTLRTIESSLRNTGIPSNDIEKVRDYTRLITETSFKYRKEIENSGQRDDRLFQTDNHIICTLGPNSNKTNGDIVIVFKREIMHHPDSNFTPQAAKSFTQFGRAYDRLKWLESAKTEQQSINNFHRSKLHCSILHYDYVAALQLIALVGSTKTNINLNLNDIQQYWMNSNAEEVFEAHLPSSVPLDYIDRIFMQNSRFDSLPIDFKDTLDKMFRGKLIKIDDRVDSVCGVPLNFQFNPYSSTSNGTYDQDLHQQIGQRMINNNSSILSGTIITLESTGFQNYACLPFTITQIIRQNQKEASAITNVYIYWEAFGGDMMLAISKNQIFPNRDQFDNPCLLCYIADMPTENSDIQKNRESYSYITNGPSDSHKSLAGDSHKLKAKSDKFNRGCNIYDFIRYCLTIDFTNDRITLTHVGSNEIYNQEKIICKFQRTEFNLPDLEYIHLSANRSNVPIRNLIVSNKQINYFHLSANGNSSENDKFPVSPSPKPIDAANINAIAANAGQRASKEQQQRRQQQQQPAWLQNNSPPKINDNKKLTPCRDGANCSEQYNKNADDSHNKRFSHPCRFFNSCSEPDKHPHLEHNSDLVPICQLHPNCPQITDPHHRCQYRHANYPDFLVPCRNERNCKDHSTDHRIKYSHGEKVQPPFIPKNGQIVRKRNHHNNH